MIYGNAFLELLLDYRLKNKHRQHPCQFYTPACTFSPLQILLAIIPHAPLNVSRRPNKQFCAE